MDGGAKNVRVLIVDDSPTMRVFEKLVVEREFRAVVVAAAADGHEAISAARREQPDLVLLDVDMPVMDGLDALPLIVAVSPHSAVVVLSSGDYAERALVLGASAFVHKGELGDTVNALTEALDALTGDGLVRR